MTSTRADDLRRLAKEISALDHWWVGEDVPSYWARLSVRIGEIDTLLVWGAARALRGS